MYDDLIRKARKCSAGCEVPSECSYFLKPPLRCMRQLLSEAADAIEELSRLNAEITRRELKLRMEKPRWIPVTEEPPLKVGDDGYNGYLVYANGYYEVADYTTDKFDNVPYFHVDGEYEPDATHWMPLPEPPKGE